jgi:hypothetical protein
VKRSCGHCGVKFVPVRSTQKFCSPRCRVATHRAAAVKTPTVPGKATPLAASHSKDGQLERSTRAELEAGERVDTMLGQAALALAREIDAGRNSGSVVGGLVRELRNTMAAALVGAGKKDDPVDEFTSRRKERLAGRGA